MVYTLHLLLLSCIRYYSSSSIVLFDTFNITMLTRYQSFSHLIFILCLFIIWRIAKKIAIGLGETSLPDVMMSFLLKVGWLQNVFDRDFCEIYLINLFCNAFDSQSSSLQVRYWFAYFIHLLFEYTYDDYYDVINNYYSIIW